ncbi:uncharacterized protein LOC134846338 [Symsagittifera roscoffensis]|uniref:uncharacterized protein LOC134846338 n=1 Tax=Symsagittifera roscoffensis TaxID=84072 RepID=UPI00307C74D6
MMKFNVSIIIFVLCIAGINTKSNCDWITIVDTQSNENKRETNLNLSAICDGICGKAQTSDPSSSVCCNFKNGSALCQKENSIAILFNLTQLLQNCSLVFDNSGLEECASSPKTRNSANKNEDEEEHNVRSRGFTIEGVIGILILFVALFVLFIYFLKTSRWRSVEYIRTACSNRFTFLLFQNQKETVRYSQVLSEDLGLDDDDDDEDFRLGVNEDDDSLTDLPPIKL